MASLARFDVAQFVFSPQLSSNKPAQGIALGIEFTLIHEALKGRHFGRSTDLVSPFQGWLNCDNSVTQGDALG